MVDPAYITALIRESYTRIAPHVMDTRLLFDQASQSWLKCEHEQTTGSFKWRGALSKLSRLPKGASLVTASTGNHGLAVATAAKRFGLHAKIFLPGYASPGKIAKLKALGADLVFVDGDSLSAELEAKAFAKTHQLIWVSPYNDEEVIAGQGTIGLELTENLEAIGRIYVTVGGGGLISGIASWLKTNSPQTEIIGCQPAFSPEMYLSVQSGKVVTAPDAQPTLSDGSAGPLEEDSITFPICAQLIDRFMLITESEIEEAIRYAWQNFQLTIEGAAGVALASALKDQNRHPENTSVVVLCGGNIDPELHRQITSGA